MVADRDLSAASAGTADVMRTDVRSELESGRCRHGDPYAVEYPGRPMNDKKKRNMSGLKDEAPL